MHQPLGHLTPPEKKKVALSSEIFNAGIETRETETRIMSSVFRGQVGCLCPWLESLFSLVREDNLKMYTQYVEGTIYPVYTKEKIPGINKGADMQYIKGNRYAVYKREKIPRISKGKDIQYIQGKR